MTKQRYDLRLQPYEGQALAKVIKYLLESPYFSDGKAVAGDCLIAHWLPLALEAEGADPETVRAAAIHSFHQLQGHCHHLQQRYGIGVARTEKPDPFPVTTQGWSNDGLPDSPTELELSMEQQLAASGLLFDDEM